MIAPPALSRDGSRSEASRDETTVIRLRARVMATLMPLAALDVERSEAVQDPAVGRLAVADRQDDGVAFVALYPLEVLDEEALVAIRVEVVCDVGRARRAAVMASSMRFACLMPRAMTPRDSWGRSAHGRARG